MDVQDAVREGNLGGQQQGTHCRFEGVVCVCCLGGQPISPVPNPAVEKGRRKKGQRYVQKVFWLRSLNPPIRPITYCTPSKELLQTLGIKLKPAPKILVAETLLSPELRNCRFGLNHSIVPLGVHERCAHDLTKTKHCWRTLPPGALHCTCDQTPADVILASHPQFYFSSLMLHRDSK